MAPEVGSAALAKVADGLAKELFQSAKGALAKSLGKFQAEFGIGFEKYLERNRGRCRYVKTLLHRIDPIPIEQAYVEPALKIKNETILGSSFPEKLDKLKNVVIVGSGGSGKSMLLKKLFLDLCEYPLGRIPLFVELRDLNSRNDKDVLKLVHHHWSELIPSFSFEALESGFRTGKFFLLLDGLDEVDWQGRDQVSRSIVAISYKFPRCPITLTSRPIDDFSAWQEFYTAEIQPFDLPRIKVLIDKTNIDGAVKKKFLSEVSKRLYKSHQAFLANPLLCTMMVLTYTEFEEIPSKMHIFYARAFDVLFTRHDKTKTFFNRKFYTTLAEDDFKKLFSTFCLFSYLEDAYSFDRDGALNFLKLVFEFEGVSIAPSDFLADLQESISILVREGDVYFFLHRSFQEYFTAVFLAERQVPKMERLFEKILKNSGENVLDLLFEMNRDALETKFLARKVKQFKSELAKLDPKTQAPQIFSLVIDHMTSDGKDSLSWMPGKYLSLLHFVIRSYPNETKLAKSVGHFIVRDIKLWHELIGGDSKGQRVDMTEISNARFQATPLARRVVELRDAILNLDSMLQKKDRTRGAFVKSLLSK